MEAFHPITSMLADFFTKSLQGNMLKQMSDKILILSENVSSDIHKCVLKNEKKILQRQANTKTCQIDWHGK